MEAWHKFEFRRLLICFKFFTVIFDLIIKAFATKVIVETMSDHLLFEFFLESGDNVFF